MYQKNFIAQMSKCLKLHSIPVTLKRTRGGYKALMPSKITRDGGAETLSSINIAPGSFRTKIDLKIALCQRFEAEVFNHCDTVYIRPRLAMKSPRWAGNRYAALPELARYAKQAGLI